MIYLLPTYAWWSGIDVNRVLNLTRFKSIFRCFELGTISFSTSTDEYGKQLVMGNQKQLYDALKSKSVDAIIGVENIIYMLERWDKRLLYNSP